MKIEGKLISWYGSLLPHDKKVFEAIGLLYASGFRNLTISQIRKALIDDPDGCKLSHARIAAGIDRLAHTTAVIKTDDLDTALMLGYKADGCTDDFSSYVLSSTILQRYTYTCTERGRTKTYICLYDSVFMKMFERYGKWIEWASFEEVEE